MFPENQMPSAAGTATAENTVEDAVETQEVDLNETVEVKDGTVDFNVVPPPPPAKSYPVQWELAEKGVVPARSQKVGQFLNVYLVGHVVAEGTDYNGYTLGEYMNSIYNKLKGTTEVHDFMNKLGHPVPNSITLADLKTHIETVLAGKPVGNAELEWRAVEKNPADRRANKEGYVTLKNRMIQFPKNPDGSYKNFVESLVDGQPVFAQAYVNKHLK